MKWITGITLNNYRAFKGSYSAIDIPANSNLLIYGENGSGKSSIYNAVKDFFNSSDNAAKLFDINLFSQIAGDDTGTIKLKIADLNANKVQTSENEFTFGKPDAQSNHRISTIKLANKVKGFLDYRRLLQTHFIETKSNENPNLFKLVVEDLLADHLIKKTTGSGVADFELLTEWKRIRNDIQNLDGRYNAHHDALAELPIFEIALKQLLILVFTEFKRLVQTYFDAKLDINVTLSNMLFERDKWKIKQELFFEIKYAGEPIPSYQTFINEARLSALGLCIYLAALKKYPPTASDLKVLYLDDVFIGLDSNNRIPLLKIIKNEFINQDFQVFLSTYDRQWFDAARNWFEAEKCKFKSLELFVNDDDGNPATPDIPVVIDPSNNLFETAINHFDAKDFPAAANYLRKTCEAELKRILPRHLTLKINFNTDEVEIHKLENLIDNFFNFLSKNNLNAIPFTHFKTYKKIIFNPLSHNDLEAPHYRKEIQDGIALVRELQKIKAKEIILVKENATTPMKLGMSQHGTSRPIHKYEIKVLENLQLIQQDTSPVQLSVVKCEIYDGTTKTEFQAMNAAFDKLRIDRGYPSSNVYTDFHANISISTHRKLNAAMKF